MVTPGIHHVLVPITDVERSTIFYRDVLEFREISRPAFSFKGAWFQLGGGQHLHLFIREDATMRAHKALDSFDVHFAMGMTSYAKTLAWLKAKGYSEDLPKTDPHSMILKANSIVGRPQIYIMDPDHNIIEFICDALD